MKLRTRPRRTPLLLAAILLPSISGCGDSPSGPADRIVAGVNVTELFAAPTDAELAAVRDDWSGRDVSARGFEIERTSTLSLGGASATLQVVSHFVDENRHYGLVLVPSDATGELPVLVYAHGGDGGIRTDELLAVAAVTHATGSEYIWVAPSFRSEPVRHPEGDLVSGGAPSPWDRDVDDALALLNVVLETVPEADPGRIGSWGVSRGGGVALLMGIRDPRIRVLVSFFGPTDFFDVFARDVLEEALLGTLRPLPGLAHLDSVLVQPLRDGTIGLDAVRLELVRRSAVLFAEALPPVQVHHGSDDAIVAVSQAESLERALDALGRAPPEYEVFLYPGAGHTPVDMPLAIPRAIAFLERIL